MSITVNIKDINRLKDIMETFPSTKFFSLVQDSSSGIGYVTSVVFYHEVNGHGAEIKIDLNSTEDW